MKGKEPLIIITIAPLTPAMIEHALPALYHVYYATFSQMPWNESETDAQQAIARVPQQATYLGFCGFAAWDEEEMVGFTYGYSRIPGNLWSEAMKRAIAADSVELWTADCFELAELAVAPQAQGKGIGGKLHDSLLAVTAHRTALLMTRPEDTPAMKMYLARGWHILSERFKITEKSDEFALLGKILRPSSLL